MKRTKKLFAAVLAAALMAVTAVPAFADNRKITEVNGTASHEVKGTYVAGAAGDTVYSVEITWGSMEFTYTAASQGTWNPETHAYVTDGTTGGRWSCDDGANEITVKNHSNANVSVTLEYEAASDYNGISGRFDESSTLNLDSAVGTNYDSAPSETATLTLSGALNSATEGKTTIGTVTVTLASAD